MKTEKYIGQKDEENFSNFSLDEVKLPTVNTVVTVEIPNETWVYLGLALLANILVFWFIYYLIKSSLNEK